MAGGNRRKSSLFYVLVRQRTSERAETAAGHGDGPTGERLGGEGVRLLCLLWWIYNDSNGMNLCVGFVASGTAYASASILPLLRTCRVI